MLYFYEMNQINISVVWTFTKWEPKYIELFPHSSWCLQTTSCHQETTLELRINQLFLYFIHSNLIQYCLSLIVDWRNECNVSSAGKSNGWSWTQHNWSLRLDFLVHKIKASRRSYHHVYVYLKHFPLWWS